MSLSKQFLSDLNTFINGHNPYPNNSKLITDYYLSIVVTETFRSLPVLENVTKCLDITIISNFIDNELFIELIEHLDKSLKDSVIYIEYTSKLGDAPLKYGFEKYSLAYYKYPSVHKDYTKFHEEKNSDRYKSKMLINTSTSYFKSKKQREKDEFIGWLFIYFGVITLPLFGVGLILMIIGYGYLSPENKR